MSTNLVIKSEESDYTMKLTDPTPVQHLAISYYWGQLHVAPEKYHHPYHAVALHAPSLYLPSLRVCLLPPFHFAQLRVQ